MSRWCDWYACPKDVLDRFLFAAQVSSDEEADEAVAELLGGLPSLRKAVPHYSLNGSWEEIHRALTDDFTGRLDFDAGEHPLCLCVHGGERLLDGSRRTMTLVHADEVPDLCHALEGIEEGLMNAKLLAVKDNVPSRYSTWDMDVAWLRYIWMEFTGLREWYRKVEKAKLPVICTISH
jgi:hypothetical protein